MFEVFAAVPLGVLHSVVSGRGILCGPLERWGAGSLFHRGIRIQDARTSRNLEREPGAWVQMQLTGNRHVFWCFQNERAPLLAAVKGFDGHEGPHDLFSEDVLSKLFLKRLMV